MGRRWSGHHIPGVANFVRDHGRGWKTVVEGYDPVIAVYQHDIEVVLHVGENFRAALLAAAVFDDVSHRADHSRARLLSARCVEQRQQLETQHAPTERKRLDHQSVRSRHPQGI